jgi:hypothetical protein
VKEIKEVSIMKRTKINPLAKLIILIFSILSVLMLGTLALAEGENQDQNIEEQMLQRIQVQNQGDRFIMGNNFESREKVKGNAVAILGNVSLGDGANGDAVAIAGNVDAKGTINGDVVSIGGNVTLEGKVNGNVVAIGGKITLKEGTVINGDIVASSLDKTADVRTGGEIIQLPIPVLNLAGNYSSGEIDFSQFNAFFYGLKVVGTIISLVILLGVLSLYPQGVGKIEASVQRDTLRVLGIGFVTFLLLIPICLTVIGIPGALVVILAGKYLGIAGVLMIIGQKFQETVRLKKLAPYVQLLVGFALMFFIGYIPFVGSLIEWVVFWLGLGAVIDSKFGTGKPWFNQKVHVN